MTRTLIIGLGGTGVNVAHAIKRRVYEFFEEAELVREGKRLVQFLLIENDHTQVDRARRYAGAAGVDVSDFLMLQGPNAVGYKQRFMELQNSKRGEMAAADRDLMAWFDPDVTFPPGVLNVGLAGNRQLGKLAAYASAGQITAHIQARMTALEAIAPEEGIDGQNVAIYIISSICGGVGSSIFLDVAALVDAATGRGIDKRAVLLLPTHFLEKLQGKTAGNELYRRYLVNSWALMQECEYFRKHEPVDRALMHRFAARPSNLAIQAQAGGSFQPFSVAYLFDKRTSTNQSLQGDDELYGFIGDSVFEMICGSANAELASALVNRSPDEERFDMHRAVACLTLEFPRAEYEAYFMARYLHDVVTLHLYKPKLSGTDIKSLEKDAESLHSAMKQRILPQALSPVTTDIEEAKELAEVLRAARDRGAYEDPKTNKIKVDADLDRLFDSRHRMFEAFITKAEKIAGESKLRYCNFQQRFSNDNEPVDQLRAAVWMAVADVVRKAGFRGLVGEPAKDVQGFISRIMSVTQLWLNELRQEAAEVSGELERVQSTLSQTRTELKRRSSTTFGGRRAARDVKNVVDQEMAQFQQLIELHKRRVVLDLQIGVVSAFCETTHQNPSPWLVQYSQQTSAAVEGNGVTKGVARWVDDGRPDGESVKARYQNSLCRTFRLAEKDVFRWCIPHSLHKLVSDDGWRSEDDGNPLGALYAAAVRTDPKLMGEMLTDSTELGPTTELLSRIGEDPGAVASKLQQLEAVMSGFFRERFLRADVPLGKFLGMSLIEAWKELDKVPDGQRIRDAFVTAAQNPPFALPIHLGAPQQDDNMRFASLFQDPQFVRFATDTLGVPRANVTQYDKEILRTRLTYLKVIHKIQFGDITSTAQCRTAYEGRDLSTSRPHIFRDFNGYREGPWNQKFAIQDTYGKHQVGSTAYELTFEEAVLFCLLMEGLRLGDKETREALYLTDRDSLLRNHWVSGGPITGGGDGGRQFRYATAGRVEQNRSGKKSATGSRLELRYAVEESSLKSWSLELDRLNFEEAFSDLRAGADGAGFRQAFGEFLKVVMSQRALVSARLKNPKAKKAAVKVLSDVAFSLRDLRLTNGQISVADATFAERIFERTSAMTKRLFGVGV